MPKGFPFRGCRECGRPIAHRIELSRSGLCADCGPEIQREATLQLIAHRGPWFEHWRRRTAASVGAVLLDDDGYPA